MTLPLPLLGRSTWVPLLLIAASSSGVAPAIGPWNEPSSGPGTQSGTSGSARQRRADDEAPGSNTVDPTDADRSERYFAICDYDGDAVISFKEAEKSLGLDREGFAAYDQDRDGLILPGEFRRRYEAIAASGGAFLPPKGKAVPKSTLPASAASVLALFDKVPNDALDARELDAALAKMGATRLEAEAVLERFDRDGTDALERAEIEELLALIRPGGSAARGPRPKSIDELFGKIVARDLEQGSTPQPPRISGPVSSFRRLDFDADGRITPEDLSELQRPLSLPVRIPAVVAALDADGDGAISPAEFQASMGRPR